MRKTLIAATLVLSLCAPAVAGDIPNPATTEPPKQSITVAEPAADGAPPDGEADGLTETLLVVIRSVLVFF